MTAPGEHLPNDMWSTHSLVVYPLNDSEIKSREKLQHDKNNSSARYLAARRGGFVFLRWLKIDQWAKVGLFATVDTPQELVVIKMITLQPFNRILASDKENPVAPEIEFSSIRDPMVTHRLPLCQSMPSFVQLNAFQVHKSGKWEPGKKDPFNPLNDEARLVHKGYDATLFYKYYNGGTLQELIDKHREKKKQVPEGFIWHFIAQIGRAFSYLHTGNESSPAFNVMHHDDIGKDDGISRLRNIDRNATVNKAVANKAWDVICHLDGHTSNIWLHYPSDEEKLRDPTLEGFTDELPQIVLGDFGLAILAKNEEWWHVDQKDYRYSDAFARGSKPEIPEAVTLRDKADMGSAMMRMMVAGLPDEMWNEHWEGIQEEEVPKRPQGRLLKFQSFDNLYSEDLSTCLDKFQLLIRMIEFKLAGEDKPNFYMHLQFTTKAMWEQFPSNDFAYGTMIALADKHVHEYISKGEMESVRWTQPKNSYFPFRSTTRNPADVRRDWMHVHGVLDAYATIEKEELPDHVKIRRADITGITVAGEPKLLEVGAPREFPSVKGQRSPKPPKPKPTPNFKTSEQLWDEARAKGELPDIDDLEAADAAQAAWDAQLAQNSDDAQSSEEEVKAGTGTGAPLNANRAVVRSSRDSVSPRAGPLTHEQHKEAHRRQFGPRSKHTSDNTIAAYRAVVQPNRKRQASWHGPQTHQEHKEAHAQQFKRRATQTGIGKGGEGE